MGWAQGQKSEGGVVPVSPNPQPREGGGRSQEKAHLCNHLHSFTQEIFIEHLTGRHSCRHLDSFVGRGRRETDNDY